VLTVGVAACGSLTYAADPRDIGTAVEIQNQVTAEQDKAAKRKLAKNDPVRELEVLEAARNASGQFVLADDTKLALGPNARLVLDKFVYDPNKTTGQVTINLAKGAFRFITGNSDKRAYEIKSPIASIGVRGTVFDGFIADNGAMAVLVHDGAVNVCVTRCLLENRQRRLIYVTQRGRIIKRTKWDPKLLPGVTIQQAFPFLGRRLAIDPVVRLNYAALQATRVAKAQPPQALTKTAAPQTQSWMANFWGAAANSGGGTDAGGGSAGTGSAGGGTSGGTGGTGGGKGDGGHGGGGHGGGGHGGGGHGGGGHGGGGKGGDGGGHGGGGHGGGGHGGGGKGGDGGGGKGGDGGRGGDGGGSGGGGGSNH
jgi:hypothetical protein